MTSNSRATPSPFYSDVRMFDRDAISRLVRNESRHLAVYLKYYLSPRVLNQTEGLSRNHLSKWYRDNRSFLRANDRGKFFVDEDARKFGIGIDSSQFIQTAITTIARAAENASLARTLLARDVPEGPGRTADVATWKKWWNENRQYLFFTDTGGFCWLIDPLAKSRGIATDKLRGPDRGQMIHN